MLRHLITTGLILGIPLSVSASSEDDATSLSYISYLERYATVQPAAEEGTIEAAINMPLVAGDRIDTAREARMELVLADGSYLWVDEYTTVSLDSVAFSRDTTSDRTVLYLADGSMMIELLPGVERPQRTRIDAATETVYLEGPGVYRLEVLRTGGLWVEVWEGLAEAASPAGGVVLRSGSASEIISGEVSSVQAQVTDRDDFARWVQSRREVSSGQSSLYVDARYGREASQLDAYGNWVYLDSANTWAWQPTVSSQWQPYNSGRWYWTSVGWSWLSYEPWGWLPYHYGSWWQSPSYGWVWCSGSVWSPAWVHWGYWPGYVSWCPVGWYSSWWWGCGWGWRGGYWGHHGGGGYYPPHGGGGTGPPRTDVVPPGSEGPARVRMDRPADASDLVLDMEGRTARSSLREGGWTAVPERDFASPHIGRLARPAGDFLRADTSRDGTATITTRPLITASPGRATPSAEVSRVLGETAGRAGPTTDLSRVVARDAGLSHDDALTAVTPSTAARLGGERIQTPAAPATEQRQAEGRSGTDPASQSLSYSSSSPSSQRTLQPNYFRSTLGSGQDRYYSGLRGHALDGGGERPSRFSGGSSSPRPSGQTLAPGRGSRNGDTGRVAPSTRESTSPQAPSSVRSHSLGRSPSSTSPTQPSGRSPSSTSPTRPSGRSPVVVPRSPSTGRAGPSRSGIVPRVSSGSSSRPGTYRGRSTYPGSSSRSSGSAPRVSSGSSRSAPRASSAPRSSSGGGRASSGSSSSGRSSNSSSSSGTAKRR